MFYLPKEKCPPPRPRQVPSVPSLVQMVRGASLPEVPVGAFLGASGQKRNRSPHIKCLDDTAYPIAGIPRLHTSHTKKHPLLGHTHLAFSFLVDGKNCLVKASGLSHFL